MPRLIKAAGYVRMSSDDQEGSPEQQRAEIEKYAAEHGYTIAVWFEDLAISGDRTEKRFGFQQMIAAGSAKEFESILCWDQDRFGRFDMIEAGRWIHPLRVAGVHLATVTDGRVDWESLAGRLVYSVKQEGKHQFLRDLSKNVIRGMDKLSAEGKWVTGVPPFGYVVDGDQRLQFGPPEDVAIVREVFARYLRGESTRQIARWLADTGVVSPKGKAWTSQGITSMLKNERYLGYLVYNQRSSSKYKDPSNPNCKMRMKPRDEWLIVPNTHPAIVTRDEWDAAQTIMQANTRKTCPNPGRATALSGLLRCGNCGYAMICDRGNGNHSYTCYAYMKRPGQCDRYSVFERDALKAILRALRTEFFDKYLTPDHVEKIREAMRARLTGKRADVDVMNAHLQKLDSQLSQAKRRLVEVDADMIRHVQERIREIEDQRDSVMAQLDAAGKPVDAQVTAVEERIRAAIDWLGRIEDLAGTDYDGQLVNSMLRQFIDKVELDIERVQWGKSGKRFKCNLTGGTVFFRLNPGVANFGGLPTAEAR